MKSKLAIPDAAPLVVSLRSVGYSLETAISDIVDNSITAKATEINIDIKWNGEISFISICDNGFGMNEAELHQSMKIGSRNPMNVRSYDDLGRFGMGMKTAAFSLCKRLSVGSKSINDNTIAIRIWDIDDIIVSNKWELLDNSTTYAWKETLKKFESYKQGTMLVLEKLDRMVTEKYNEQSLDRFWQRINDLERHLSMVFHRFISGPQAINISLNGKKIEAWDPFMRFSLATQEFREEFIECCNSYIKVHTFILPHHSKMSVKEYDSMGGLGGWLDQQGFYVYRNKRLIIWGTWFKMLRKNEPSQLARIQLDLTSQMDFEWKIDVKKSYAAPPALLRDKIRRIARTAQDASRKVYYYRGAIINQQIKDEDNDAIWEQSSVRGRTFYKINHSHALLKEVYSKLDVNSVKHLNTYLKLLEGFAPMNASSTVPVFDEPKYEDEIIQSAVNFYNDLVEIGYSSIEALRKILQISIYEGMAEVIKKKLHL